MGLLREAVVFVPRLVRDRRGARVTPDLSDALAARWDKIAVRALRRDDETAVSRLCHAAFDTPPPPRLVSRYVRMFHGISLLVSRAGDPVGYVLYRVFRRGSARIAWLFSIAVDPSARGAGIGRVALEHSVAALRSAGFDAVELEVEADNAPAVRLYERLGFETVDRHDDQLVMRLPLAG